MAVEEMEGPPRISRFWMNKGSKKRSRREMSLAVLKQMSRGTYRPTHLMYKCNLSWIPLQEILANLLKSGLIRRDKASKYRTAYVLTRRGERALKADARLSGLLGEAS